MRIEGRDSNDDVADEVPNRRIVQHWPWRVPGDHVGSRAKRVSDQYKGDRRGGDPQMNLEAATF